MALDPQESFRREDSSRQRLPCCSASHSRSFIKPGSPCQSHCFRHSSKRNASAPTFVADEFPRPAVRYVIQHLPNHDTRALESWLAVTDFGISHDVLA